MSVRLFLLGSPSVQADGDSFALPFERRGQLVAFLALKGEWVPRSELAAMLWPEQDAKLAYTNLRKALFRLQSQPWARIETRGNALRFDAETDVAAFETALREQRLDEALRFYRGALLTGFDDDASEAWSSWLGFERERLRSAWRSAALQRLAGDIAPADGVALSSRLLEDDPLDESAMRAHLLHLGRDGQAAQARQAYRGFAARLAEELGLSPGADLQVAHDSLARTAAPAMTIPPADDGFIGRSVELRQIASLLSQSGCRLVNVIGAGGVGKTRIARRALSELGGDFRDGAAFVALEGAHDANDIAAAMARALGIDVAGRRDPLAQLLDAIRDRELLLVLDNLEQLTAEAPLLSQILKSCAGVKLLVTSRARLGLPAEQLLPLEGLPCPDAEDQDRLEAFDAPRLFIKAARRVQPGFSPEAEARSIAEICRLVEGLPLAIELAAAWTRVMPCEEIAVQLRLGESLLEGMESVFEQSWRLLTQVERDALSRLSVFNGSFSVEAAKAVAGAPLPVLGALVDKSLLRKDGMRLQMHPLVHQFAGARLRDHESQAATRRAHAVYFHELMARLRRGVEDGNREALQAMEIEWQNCRAAWRWSLTHDMREAVARGMPALLHFSDHRFRLREGLALLREALEAPSVRADQGLEALLLASSAHMEYRLDRYAEAEANAIRALAATGASSHHDTRLQCFKVLGASCLRLGRLEDARKHFKQALKQAPESVDPNNAAAMLDNLAIVEKSLGRYDQALKMSHRSLMQHRLLGDVAGEALCLNNLGDMYIVVGNYDAAREHLREGLALCEKHGLVNTSAIILSNLSDLALRAGDLAAAEEQARKALELTDASGQRGLAAWLKSHVAELAVRRGDMTAARSELASALELAVSMSRPSLQFVALLAFAKILIAEREIESAAGLLAFCISQPSIPAPERDNMRATLDSLPAARAKTATAWPGLGLDELVNRVIVESSAGHAPLIATLRGR